MKILLTGAPKIGKSTIIQKFIRNLTGSIHGIVVSRMYDENGKNQGFQAKSLSGGGVRTIAHRSLVNSDIVVGNGHKVDIQAIDDFVVPEIENGIRDNTLTVVDEIGIMQAHSSLFLETVEKLLNSKCPVLGTIVYDDEPFSRPFKNLSSVILVQVTLENRDMLPELLHIIFTKRDVLSTLSPKQSQVIHDLLQGYFDNGSFTQIKKLFNNALSYLRDDRVHKKGGNYEVRGNTHAHSVLHENGKHTCDCDLFNGGGKYKEERGDCSHIQAVILSES